MPVFQPHPSAATGSATGKSETLNQGKRRECYVSVAITDGLKNRPQSVFGIGNEEFRRIFRRFARVCYTETQPGRRRRNQLEAVRGERLFGTVC